MKKRTGYWHEYWHNPRTTIHIVDIIKVYNPSRWLNISFNQFQVNLLFHDWFFLSYFWPYMELQRQFLLKSNKIDSQGQINRTIKIQRVAISWCLINFLSLPFDHWIFQFYWACRSMSRNIHNTLVCNT